MALSTGEAVLARLTRRQRWPDGWLILDARALTPRLVTRLQPWLPPAAPGAPDRRGRRPVGEGTGSKVNTDCNTNE